MNKLILFTASMHLQSEYDKILLGGNIMIWIWRVFSFCLCGGGAFYPLTSFEIWRWIYDPISIVRFICVWRFFTVKMWCLLFSQLIVHWESFISFVTQSLTEWLFCGFNSWNVLRKLERHFSLTDISLCDVSPYFFGQKYQVWHFSPRHFSLWYFPLLLL